MSNTTQYWVNNIDPVIFRIYGDIAVRYYGIAYLLGFIFTIIMLKIYYRAGKSSIDSNKIDKIIFAIVAGVLVGGRLGYMLFYSWSEFINNPLLIFCVWQGGMSSHGGFIGVAIALLWISYKHKIPFFQIGDFICSIAPIGLFFGRIANFINGELWGKISTVPWAVIFPKSAPAGTPVELITPRHPSQLYEATLEGLILFIYVQLRFWFSHVQKNPGRLSGEFLILYAILRIIGEQFREPDAGLIFGMSRGVFFSIFILLAGIVFILHSIYPIYNYNNKS